MAASNASSSSESVRLDALEAHVRSASRLVVLTGAGISTPSGIPDYRSPDGSYSRGHKPITHAEFVRKAENRQRYWARSFIGFEVFSRSRPNAAHLALAELERGGWIGGGCITQNVDGLHAAAGMRDCLDLHGRIDAVEACTAARVGEQHQIDEWGEVEMGHDLDAADCAVHLSASSAFLQLLDRPWRDPGA